MACDVELDPAAPKCSAIRFQLRQEDRKVCWVALLVSSAMDVID
jgi:hypothetical protein